MEKGKIVHINEIGICLEEVQQLYDNGQIEGIIFLVALKDETVFQHVTCGDINSTKSISMLETAKFNFLMEPYLEEE